MRAEGHVDAHAEAGGHQLLPAARAQAVEHLELEARGPRSRAARVARSSRPPAPRRGWRSPGSSPFASSSWAQAANALRIDAHVLDRDLRRLPVGALAQPHAVLAAHRLLHVVGGPVQVGLQHDARRCRGACAAPGRLEIVLSVSFEPSMSSRTKPPVSRAASRICDDVLEAQLARDLLAHRGHLDRDVALDARGISRSSVARRASVARPAASRSMDVLAQLVEGGLDALRAAAARRRAPRPAAARPATKRLAKIVSGFIASPRGPSPGLRSWR